MRNQEIEKLLHDICNVPPCFDFLIFLNTCPINVHIYFIEGAIFRNFKKLKWSSSHITSISGWLSQTSIHFYNVCRKLSQIRSKKMFSELILRLMTFMHESFFKNIG